MVLGFRRTVCVPYLSRPVRCLKPERGSSRQPHFCNSWLVQHCNYPPQRLLRPPTPWLIRRRRYKTRRYRRRGCTHRKLAASYHRIVIDRSHEVTRARMTHGPAPSLGASSTRSWSAVNARAASQYCHGRLCQTLDDAFSVSAGPSLGPRPIRRAVPSALLHDQLVSPARCEG